jgi:hypothetical protein
MLSPPADDNQNSLQPRVGNHAACQFPAWNPGVHVESRRPKGIPWRPRRLLLNLVLSVRMAVSD